MKSLITTIVSMVITAMVYAVAVGTVIGGSPGAVAAWVSVGFVASMCGLLCGSAIVGHRQRGGASRAERA